jgi:hypothetical protein
MEVLLEVVVEGQGDGIGGVGAKDVDLLRRSSEF